ncbi:hypothetical protein [Cellulomonas alba]|uniref:S1 motif domain-containing protein n=1 Tax=Cellulomonas alba TaxID=3053467 RepID=A0ABT7SBU9_9CELL|nr:hypothetical protein [Cellulomonas alba]MDM7853656.1 hypothetical protein [Cellulomonas alba]
MVRRKRSRELPSADVTTPPLVPVVVPRGVSRVARDDDAHALATRLLTPGRSWPVAVVTIASGQTEPFVDVDELADALQGLVEVVVMPTSDVSWVFSAAMPNQTQVYGGASRVYPIDHGWVVRPSVAPLRFAYSMRERQSATDLLIGDGMASAVAAGLYAPRSSSTQRRAAGEVLGVLGPRALIRLDDGSPASLWEELTGYDVPLDRLVRAGQPLSGTVDPETRRLVLDAPEPARWPDRYEVGAVVLAEVVAAEPALLTLRPVYGIDCDLDRAAVTGNDNDRLDALFAPGDVVVARVVGVERPALSLLDVDDDDQPVDPPAILAAGPPWLLIPAVPQIVPLEAAEDAPPPDDADQPASPTTQPVESTPVPTTAEIAPSPVPRSPTPLDLRAGKAFAPPTPSPVAATPRVDEPVGPAVRDLSLSLQTAQARIKHLERELATASGAEHEARQMREHSRALERRLEVSEAERKAFRVKYRDADRARQRLEHDSAQDPVEVDTRAWFETTEDALRFSVTAVWAARVPAGEKSRWPLRDWSIGPAFDESLEALGPVSWRKLAEVVCDVVIGDPQRLRALDHHELRLAESGGAPPVTREDGSTCFRVALQRNSPSARRLHYWRRGDYVELSRVVLHDDLAP